MPSNWKIKISGVADPVDVSTVIDFCKKDGQSQLYSLRKELATQEDDGQELISCHHCSTPVIVTRRKKKIYIKHKPSSDGSTPYLIGDSDTPCPFYQGKENPIFEDRPKSESKTTKLLKVLVSQNVKLSKNVLKRTVKINKVVIDKTDESKWRSPHVYFEKKDGTKWAIEVLRSWINPSLISDREEFYKDNNIHLMWVVYMQSIGVESITFGDLMYGQSKEKNVFAISYESVKKSFHDNEFILHAFYPGDIGEDSVIGKNISFDKINLSSEGSPYYKDCSNISLESLRDYLVRLGVIDEYSTESEVVTASEINSANKTISAAKRTSEIFVFHKKDILSSLTSINKIDTIKYPSFAKEVKKLDLAFNLNLKILDAITESDGRKGFKRHLGQIARYRNSKSVLKTLISKNIVTYDEMIPEDSIYKNQILSICEEDNHTFDDLLLLNKARMECLTNHDSKKLKSLIDILFSSTINKATLLNRTSESISGGNKLLDTIRILKHILSIEGIDDFITKEGSISLTFNSGQTVSSKFKDRKYQNPYFQEIVRNIYITIEKHRPTSKNSN